MLVGTQVFWNFPAEPAQHNLTTLQDNQQNRSLSWHLSSQKDVKTPTQPLRTVPPSQFIAIKEGCVRISSTKFRARHLELSSGGGIIVPLQLSFPRQPRGRASPESTLSFQSRRITSIFILCDVQILCSSCFSNCQSISSSSWKQIPN
jgi:hypothetical protein